MQNKQIVFIRELLKDKSEEEIVEAERNFREFLQVAWDIFQRENGEESEGTINFLGDDEDLGD